MWTVKSEGEVPRWLWMGSELIRIMPFPRVSVGHAES